jgi:mono/diheme cytochrome c family protein
MRVLLALTAFSALCACAAQPAPLRETAPMRADVHAGAALAQRQCAACHAIGATGASPMEEAPAFRRLGERYPPGSLAEAFAEGVIVGHPAMPEFEFTPEEIENLIAYMEWIQAGGSVPQNPAN